MISIWIYEHFQKGRLNNIIYDIGDEPITVTCEVWIPDRTGHWYGGYEPPEVSIVRLVVRNSDYNYVTNFSHRNLYSSFSLQLRQLNLTKKYKVLNKLISDGLVNKNKEDPGRKGRGNSP